MRKNQEFSSGELKKRAKEFARAGFSVIPVFGNSAPAEPKKPAVKWRRFQREIAS